MFKIYVGNLSVKASADAIRDLFSRHADVDDIALPLNDAGKPRGFAIVMIKDEKQGRSAISALRGTRMDNRRLIINEARKKGKAPLRRPGSRLRGRFRPNSRRMAPGSAGERSQSPRTPGPGQGGNQPPSSPGMQSRGF
jgi:RNA recognition motif-containing protein